MAARFRAIVLLSCLSFLSVAQATPTWESLHERYGIDSSSHAFCFRSQSGEVLGANINLPVRLASVSKLLTTLWAIEVQTPRFQYDTQFYYKDGKLHIKGDKDTIFSRRKLFYLVNQLNHYGIEKISEITFDKKTKVYARAEEYIGTVLDITPERTAQNLKDFLTTTQWNKLLPVYRSFYRETPVSLRDRFQIRELSELQLDIGDVRLSESPSFDIEKADIKFSVLSSALQDYMKFMNVLSNNNVADQTFINLGAEKAFDAYIKQVIEQDLPHFETQLKEDQSTQALIKMYSGSGLDTKRKGQRVDNFATCSLTIALIERLHRLSRELEAQIQNMVAVVAVDGGTFKTRLRAPYLKNSIVAKTGTLFHTSALAGIVYAQDAVVPFGIFHQATGSKIQVRQIQNDMVRTLVDQYGGPQKFYYRPQAFFPVGNEKL